MAENADWCSEDGIEAEEMDERPLVRMEGVVRAGPVVEAAGGVVEATGLVAPLSVVAFALRLLLRVPAVAVDIVKGEVTRS